jgi:hypothetical protein
MSVETELIGAWRNCLAFLWLQNSKASLDVPHNTSAVQVIVVVHASIIKTSSIPSRPPLRENREEIRTARSMVVITTSGMANAGIQPRLPWGKFSGKAVTPGGRLGGRPGGRLDAIVEWIFLNAQRRAH